MRTLTIDFTSAKLLPEGCDAGYIGEHNATQITIIPPVEMADCESIATYVVAFATSKGVLYSDSFLKSEEITVSLTSKLTTDYYLGVQLEGYDSEGELVVKSPLVTQLQLSPSARGTGCEADGGTIDGGTVEWKHIHDNKEVLDLIGVDDNMLTFNGNEVGGSSDVEGHAHENKDTLDLIGQEGDSLTFGGKRVGGAVVGSKYYTNNWKEGIIVADVSSTGTIDFYINEEYPENRIITDVSVHINEDGEIKEYSLLGLYINGMFGGTASPYISRKAVLNANYGMYAVAMISNLDAATSDFYAQVSASSDSVMGLTVHYLEV